MNRYCRLCHTPDYQLTEIIPPSIEPLTINDLKNSDYFKDIDIDLEQTFFEQKIKEARERGQKLTNKKFMLQTWKVVLDCYPKKFIFPWPYLQNVTEVRVIQVDGTITIEDTEKYDFTIGDNAELWLKKDQEWSETDRSSWFFEIEFEVGFSDAASLPTTIKESMKQLIGYLYYNREEINIKVPNVFASEANIRW